ncbi:porin [Parashewanella curva]|uniref:Porin n=1 Tax=Parashewanella curva TaxID=2338552 RepID=A0A3L8Q207_9GAMM|nr:porin [Parashewanella curva]RLV61510.1 porin [Parashewanella curva]
MQMFNKTLLATTIFAATTANAFADTMLAGDALKVYGKVNLSVQNSDFAKKQGNATNYTDETKVKSNASRLGVKGKYKLDGGLEAFYTLEYQVNIDSDDKDTFTARNQYVGVRGGFGSVSVGRNDTITKKSQGKVDLFNDLDGDIKNLFKGDNRLSQTVTYVSPSVSGFTFGATYVAEAAMKQGDTNGVSLAAMYGDAKLKKSKFYAALAYDKDVAGYNVLRATAHTKLGNLKLGAMFQQQESTDEGSKSTNGYLVSAAYSMDSITFKVQAQDMDDKGKSWSAGADYKLAKPTKVFAFFTNRKFDGIDHDDQYVGVGIEHKF